MSSECFAECEFLLFCIHSEWNYVKPPVESCKLKKIYRTKYHKCYRHFSFPFRNKMSSTLSGKNSFRDYYYINEIFKLHFQKFYRTFQLNRRVAFTCWLFKSIYEIILILRDLIKRIQFDNPYERQPDTLYVHDNMDGVLELTLS